MIWFYKIYLNCKEKYIEFGDHNRSPIFFLQCSAFSDHNVRFIPLFTDELPINIRIFEPKNNFFIIKFMSLWDAGNWKIEPTFIQWITLCITVSPKLYHECYFARNAKLLLEQCCTNIASCKFTADYQVIVVKFIAVVWFLCLRCENI